MNVVLVTFEVSVSKSKDPFVKVGKPDYVFEGEFDKDDDSSFHKMCELEFRVQHLVKAFVDLDCQVVALRKEVSHISI